MNRWKQRLGCHTYLTLWTLNASNLGERYTVVKARHLDSCLCPEKHGLGYGYEHCCLDEQRCSPVVSSGHCIGRDNMCKVTCRLGGSGDTISFLDIWQMQDLTAITMGLVRPARATS